MFEPSCAQMLSLEGLQGLLCALQLLLQIFVGCLHDHDTFQQMSSTNLSVWKLAAPAVCSAGRSTRHFAGRPGAQHEIQTERTRMPGFLILLTAFSSEARSSSDLRFAFSISWCWVWQMACNILGNKKAVRSGKKTIVTRAKLDQQALAAAHGSRVAKI